MANLQSEKISQHANTIAIVCGALMLGVLSALVPVVFMVGVDQITTEMGLRTWIGLIMGAGLFIGSFIAPMVSTSNAVEAVRKNYKDSPENRLLAGESLAASYVTSMIIRFAIIEGAVFCNLVFFFTEHSVATLVLIGVGLLLMFAQFPFPGRMVGKIEDQLSGIAGKLL